MIIKVCVFLFFLETKIKIVLSSILDTHVERIKQGGSNFQKSLGAILSESQFLLSKCILIFVNNNVTNILPEKGFQNLVKRVRLV